MAIPAIGSVVSAAAASPTVPSIPSVQSQTAGAAAGSSGDFGAQAAQAIDQLQGVQNQSDLLATQAATGQGNVADVMIAATQAQLQTEMTVAIRDKAVDAFNQIMGMPL